MKYVYNNVHFIKRMSDDQSETLIHEVVTNCFVCLRTDPRMLTDPQWPEEDSNEIVTPAN